MEMKPKRPDRDGWDSKKTGMVDIWAEVGSGGQEDDQGGVEKEDMKVAGVRGDRG